MVTRMVTRDYPWQRVLLKHKKYQTAKVTSLNESKCSFLYSDCVESYKNEFLKHCYFITFASKTTSSLVPKNFSIHSIVNTALTIMRFCGVTESYYQIFLFLIGKVFKDRCTTKPQIQLTNVSIQSLLKDRPRFQKILSEFLKLPFQNAFNFGDNQSQKL